jgi:hypothetical protein
MLTTINWRHFWISPLARPGIRHNIRRHTATLAMPQSQSNLVGHTSKFSAARDGLRGAADSFPGLMATRLRGFKRPVTT